MDWVCPVGTLPEDDETYSTNELTWEYSWTRSVRLVQHHWPGVASSHEGKPKSNFKSATSGAGLSIIASSEMMTTVPVTRTRSTRPIGVHPHMLLQSGHCSRGLGVEDIVQNPVLYAQSGCSRNSQVSSQTGFE